MKESFKQWQKDLDRAQEALSLGVSSNQLATFFEYAREDQENILAQLKYEKKMGEK